MKKYLILIAAGLIGALLTGCCALTGISSVMKQTPPAGTYYVSSVGTEDGDMLLYSLDTEELMIIEEDGTGTFYYGETLYNIAFENGKLTVDGEQVSYTFMPGAPDESLLMLYWYRDGINSIALRLR